MPIGTALEQDLNTHQYPHIARLLCLLSLAGSGAGCLRNPSRYAIYRAPHISPIKPDEVRQDWQVGSQSHDVADPLASSDTEAAKLPDAHKVAQDNVNSLPLMPSSLPTLTFPNSTFSAAAPDHPLTLASDTPPIVQAPTPPAGTLNPDIALVAHTQPVPPPPHLETGKGNGQHSQPVSTVAQANITLQIDNVRPKRGAVRVAVFTEADKFLNPAGMTQTLVLKDDTSTATTSLTMKQPFAIAVYQDINGDGQLTRNAFGVPTEPFGFSNNPPVKRGPPKYHEAVIAPANAPSAPTIVHIKLP